MQFAFVTVTSKTPTWLAEICLDYQKKISFWIPTGVHFLKSQGRDRALLELKKKEDSEKVLSFLNPNDFVLLCDERGKEMDSGGVAKKIENILNGGKKRVVVVVGGSYGVTDEVKSRADFQLRLSSLTTNHHLALAVVLEQVYRAMTILKNVKYHND